MKIRVLLLLVLLLPACHGHQVAKRNAELQSWVGHTRTQLLERFGVPTSIIQDGELEVMTYRFSRTITDKSPSTVINPKSNLPIIMGGDTTSVTRSNDMLFWINKEGVVVKCVYH